MDNIQWNDLTSKQKSFTFTEKSGFLIELLSDITPDEVLSLFLKKKVMRLLVTKTNRHANQKSFQHPNSNKKMKTHYFRRNEKIYLTDDLNTDATNSMLVNGLHLKFSVFT